MAVFYKMYQDNREGQETKGKWYARAVHTGKVTENDLAEEIEANCTVKRSDVLAVLSELGVVMTRHLQMSHSVKLDSIGTFKIGISTRPAEKMEDFNVNENVKSVHMLFQPETTIDTAGTRTRAFLSGCKVKELPKNAIGA